jgi:hypothetical protein
MPIAIQPNVTDAGKQALRTALPNLTILDGG